MFLATAGLLLVGIFLVTRSMTRGGALMFVAGLCFGVAATFKQTTGAFGAMAVALFLLTGRNAEQAVPTAAIREFLAWDSIVRAAHTHACRPRRR